MEVAILKIEKEPFGKLGEHKVEKYTLTNNQNVSISVLNYGGIWQGFYVPDTHGGRVNLILGSDNLQTYVDTASLCAGRIIGRTAGRIGGGEFDIDGKHYQVDQNEGKNCLHGGAHGLGENFWDVKTSEGPNLAQIILTTTITHKQDTFPANEKIQVAYTLNESNTVTIDFVGESDGTTLFNPTNHTYWNLSGEAKTIQGHILQINSTTHLEVDDGKIPTGRKLLNEGTPFDFSNPTVLGTALQEMQNTKEGGFDDIWVVEPSNYIADQPIATLMDAANGRKIKMYSDRNGLVAYTANGLHIKGYNRPANPWFAIALEGQTLPDTPHHPSFGDISLRPEQPRHYQLRYEYFA